MPTPFLTAHWHFMAMLNFELDPEILRRRLPAGTELDLHEGKALISVVGFMFSDARIMGMPVPMHREFEEVNLRYYVRRETPDGMRRGVTFIKEIVPRWAVAQTAKLVYNENFVALPMRHEIDADGDKLLDNGVVHYGWRVGPRWYRLRVKTEGKPFIPPAGSEERFVIDHWHAYTAQDQVGCMEFFVEHPPWRIWNVSDALLESEITTLYGAEFKAALQGRPHSAFLCEGSPVTVYRQEYVPVQMAKALVPVSLSFAR